MSILLSFVPVALLHSAEPSGHLQFDVLWVREDVVRLQIRPLVPLVDGALSVSAPTGSRLQPLGPDSAEFRHVDPIPQRQGFKRDGIQLNPSVTTEFEFEWVLTAADRGVLEFIVEGTDGSGRRVRDAIGFAVQADDDPLTIRLGAAEYPATVLRSEGSR
ncbi:MAG: hypothetical protein OEV00_12340 [Acidobacteriota bacterium]|nr:hypothetical protein [Acidobacteriota bacterium]MDH3786100.1 hypothetical protein [Acidobacteriota bacterium]